MTLPKNQRVVSKKDIGCLLKSRIAVYDLLFHGKIVSHTGDCLRLVVVVSKKISKRAVVRNRIKRRISRTVELWARQSSLRGVDISIVVAKPIAVLLPWQDLGVQLHQLLSQLGQKHMLSASRAKRVV